MKGSVVRYDIKVKDVNALKKGILLDGLQEGCVKHLIKKGAAVQEKRHPPKAD